MSYLNFVIFVLMLLIFSPNAEGGKRRVRVPQDLADVIDNEEDEAWKNWDKDSTPASDGSGPSDFETMVMTQHAGPVFGYVKLQLGVPRTMDEVSEIATRWTKVLRTVAVDITFTVLNTNTAFLFTLQNGRHSLELKEFILNEPEAYEIKIGDNAFCRPGDPEKRLGDPTLEELIEQIKT